jgi:Predicted membrane protein
MDFINLVKTIEKISMTHVVFLFLFLVVGLTSYAAANPYITTTGYTEFYISGENATESPYLSTMSTQSTEEVPLIIENREHSLITYQLSVQWNGTETNQTSITLDPQEQHTISMTVRAPAEAATYRLEFLLESSQTVEVDLSTRLWITVKR